MSQKLVIDPVTRVEGHGKVTVHLDDNNKVKDAFLSREGEKLTFTPIFMQAIATTIKKFPLINIAIDGDHIIKKKNINLGL